MPYAIDIEAPRPDLKDDDLAAAVNGERPDLDAAVALKLLASRGSARLEQAAGQALLDRRRDVGLRLTAAHALAALEPARAQSRLLAALGDDPAPRVTAAVVLALGAIGDAQALRALDSFKPPASADLGDALAFARTLASHRLGAGSHPVAVPGAARRLKLAAREARPIDCEPETFESTELLAGLRSRLPGLALSARGAMRLRCAGNTLLAVFGEGFDRAEGLRSLSERIAVPIVMFEAGRSLERPYLVDWILSRPAKAGGSADLVGVRPRGQVGYVGSVSPQGDGFVFRFQAVASAHTAATEFEALYLPATATWQVARAESHPRVDRKRVPFKRPRPAGG